MSRDGLLPAIRHRTYIAAPPGDVFPAVATGDGWCGWFATAAQIDPEAGGSYRFEWRAFGPDHVDLVLEGQVLVYDPDRTFAFEWDSGAARTTVEITLEPRGDGCVVEVVDSGYPDSVAGVRSLLDCACGWGEALTLLKFHVEHGSTYGTVPAGEE